LKKTLLLGRAALFNLSISFVLIIHEFTYSGLTVATLGPPILLFPYFH
jgi:hypothetical protein